MADIDERMSHDEHVPAVRAARHRVGDALLLRARNEVVDEDARAPAGSGTELVELRGEHVDALEVLHDHALDAEVGAPHLLDELGVVPAFDEDATG